MILTNARTHGFRLNEPGRTHARGYSPCRREQAFRNATYGSYALVTTDFGK